LCAIFGNNNYMVGYLGSSPSLKMSSVSYFYLIYFGRHVTLVPDDPEDMWHAYNLVSVGDRLRSTTIRLVISKKMSH
jgi:hypothetical protein